MYFYLRRHIKNERRKDSPDTVAINPKHIIKNLKSEVNEIKKSIEKGDQPIFDSIDCLFEELDK